MKRVFYGKTDVGLRRPNNEDAWLVRPDLDFCVVADGMGGAASGELASRMFVETVQELFTHHRPGSEQEACDVTQEAFRLGNQRILSFSAVNPSHQGMGCTAELIVFLDDRYVTGHVGDSRTYLFRDGVLRQITHDHSLVQNQLDQGLITEMEARRHSMRHVVLRALGIREPLALDLSRGTCRSGDVFLLCSDGLTDMIEDDVIRDILSGTGELAVAVDRLIECAKSAGGADNITVVLCQVLPS
jgi:PPM family protein phosphatase